MVIAVTAIGFVVAVAALPYAVSLRARFGLRFCGVIALVEAVLLSGWFIFGAAIVTPVTLSIILQGLAAGSVFALLVLGGWLASRRLFVS